MRMVRVRAPMRACVRVVCLCPFLCHVMCCTSPSGCRLCACPGRRSGWRSTGPEWATGTSFHHASSPQWGNHLSINTHHQMRAHTPPRAAHSCEQQQARSAVVAVGMRTEGYNHEFKLKNGCPMGCCSCRTLLNAQLGEDGLSTGVHGDDEEVTLHRRSHCLDVLQHVTARVARRTTDHVGCSTRGRVVVQAPLPPPPPTPRTTQT